MITSIKKGWLGVEFILLYVGIPLYIYLDYNFMNPTIVIAPLLIFMLVVLKQNSNFKFNDLFRIKLNRVKLKIHGAVFFVNTSILLLVVYFLDKDNMFILLKVNPRMLIGFCILYPIFSAYGQEIIYRVFFFHRYKPIFKSDIMLVLISSLSFSYMHIVYYSHVSVILTLILGIYLSFTYLKTKSVLLVAILHSIYGILVFVVGLGNYFWLDMSTWM